MRAGVLICHMPPTLLSVSSPHSSIAEQHLPAPRTCPRSANCAGVDATVKNLPLKLVAPPAQAPHIRADEDDAAEAPLPGTTHKPPRVYQVRVCACPLAPTPQTARKVWGAQAQV